MDYTKEQDIAEFWMLTKGILQDGSVDTEEASVIRNWLKAHGKEEMCPLVIKKLDKFLQDGYIDRFEAAELTASIGSILRALREQK